jgi:hypothetical protein
MEKKIELVVEHQAEHDQDIFKYVQSKLKAKDKDIHRQILEKAQHIFFWVVLIVKLLNIEFNKGKIKAMRQKLDEIPSDLDELFSKLLEKEDSEDDKKTTILVFQWVLFSVQPLKPTELYFAVLAGTDPKDLGAWDRSQVDFETIKRFITWASRGLVEIVSENEYYTDNEDTEDDTDDDTDGDTDGDIEDDIEDDTDGDTEDDTDGDTEDDPDSDTEDNTDDDDTGENQDVVQFIHQSIIDFLTRNQRLVKLDPTLAPNAIGASHARLASCCMAYIMQEEFRLLAMDISSIANSDKGVLEEMKESYPLLEYTSVNLLAHAENAQAEGMSQISLLRRLEERGGYEILQLLHDIFVRLDGSFKGAQLLYWVSLQGFHYLVQALLLERRANVNAQGGHYGTALQAAAGTSRTDMAVLLLEHGANVNAQGGDYGTALYTAVAQGNRDIVALLLDRGANVNAQSRVHGTALQAAAARGNRDIVALLLDRGAKCIPP